MHFYSIYEERRGVAFKHEASTPGKLKLRKWKPTQERKKIFTVNKQEKWEWRKKFWKIQLATLEAQTNCIAYARWEAESQVPL